MGKRDGFRVYARFMKIWAADSAETYRGTRMAI